MQRNRILQCRSVESASILSFGRELSIFRIENFRKRRHDSVRKFAIRSYAASQKGKMTKVQAFLGKYRSDSNLGFFVEKTLKEVTADSKTSEKKNESRRETDRSDVLKTKK